MRDARTADDTGISEGLLALDCGDFGAGIGVGLVRTDPQLVTLGWEDRKVVLECAPSRSGAEYSGKAFDGPYMLWIKGNEATFDTPEKKGYACRVEVPG
jgi:membrane-bound inhibitor of C-type lysozyme